MNPFLRYLADKNSAHTHTDRQTDTRRWPQDLAAYGAQVKTTKRQKRTQQTQTDYNEHWKRHRRCGVSKILFTNRRRRFSIMSPIYGKSQYCRMTSIFALSWTLKTFATACFTQSSSNFTELLESGIASVPYSMIWKSLWRIVHCLHLLTLNR